MKRIVISAMLVAVMCTVAVAMPYSPFMICGWITTDGGEPCNNPVVQITNANTSMIWYATSSSSYYQLMLDSGNVSAGDLLRFNVSGCGQARTFEHTVTQEEINNGLLVFNVSLEAPQEVIWQGNVTLINGTTFSVTAHNSGNEWVVNSTTALGALAAAAEAGKFNYTVTDEWGAPFVDSIADIHNEGWNGWMYWVNYPDEDMPMVSASNYTVEDSDVVIWYWSSSMNTTPANSTRVLIINVTVFQNDFDTTGGTYPSIAGTHNGTIKPNRTTIVNKLYTYPCAGTGGHTEYVRIWGNGVDVNATWTGYNGDWHNITFDKPFKLYAGTTYNYTIRTGSYPQIWHTRALPTDDGWINCTSFVDANGYSHNNWIPAIRLFYEGQVF